MGSLPGGPQDTPVHPDLGTTGGLEWLPWLTPIPSAFSLDIDSSRSPGPLNCVPLL